MVQETTSYLGTTLKVWNRKSLMLYLIFDKSGSMCGAEGMIPHSYYQLVEYIENYNISLSTTLFAWKSDEKHEWMPPGYSKNLIYEAYGATALYDAIDRAITRVNEKKEDINYDFCDADVLYVILTDGYDNSSSISKEEIREIIRSEKSIERKGRRYFLLLADFCIDHHKVAKELGIDTKFTQLFVKDERGIQMAFDFIKAGVESDVSLNNWLAETNNYPRNGERWGSYVARTAGYRKKLHILSEFLSDIESFGICNFEDKQKRKHSLCFNMKREKLGPCHQKRIKLHEIAKELGLSQHDDYVANIEIYMLKIGFREIEKSIIQNINKIVGLMCSTAFYNDCENVLEKCKYYVTDYLADRYCIRAIEEIIQLDFPNHVEVNSDLGLIEKGSGYRKDMDKALASGILSRLQSLIDIREDQLTERKQLRILASQFSPMLNGRKSELTSICEQTEMLRKYWDYLLEEHSSDISLNRLGNYKIFLGLMLKNLRH